jgi:mannose/fructose-specific phosphotransferase system component IIA
MDGQQDELRPIDFLTDEEREQEIARLQEEARRHQAEADELLRYKRERQARRSAS